MKKNILGYLVLFCTLIVGCSNNKSSMNSSSSTNNFELNDTFAKYAGSYYNSIDGKMTIGIDGELRKSLTSLIQVKKYYAFGGAKTTELGYLLSRVDIDENNSQNMVLFYCQDRIPQETTGASRWNREHIWPQSLSNDLFGKTGAGCDMHHIRPTAYSTNSARGNLLFGSVNHDSGTKVFNTTYKTNSLGGFYNSQFYEPIDSVKGDCARICFYLYTCYFNSGKLDLNNVAQSIELLKKWNDEDLPSEQEMIRNQKVFELQGNRNPFIDHPELVDVIF